MSSVNNGIPFVPENTIDPAAGLNESINVIDALLQVAAVSVGENTPPGSPAAGARYIVGTSPTGAWSGQANKLARWLDGTWSFFDARYAVSLSDNKQYIRGASGWSAIDSSGEWSAETVSQAEAEAGTATTRRAWTAQRVRQAIVAWWNSVSSAWGRGFVASAGAAAGRTALGLGSAATATLQTSSTDEGTGRAMVNGAWGLGLSGSSHATGTDYDTVARTQFIQSSESNNPSLLTSGLPGGYFNGINFHRSTTVHQRMILNWTSGVTVPRLFLQTKALGGPWTTAEAWTNVNLTPNVLTSYTLATLPNAAANPRLQAWCSNLTGGAMPVYSDGTNWRRTFDNSIAN